MSDYDELFEAKINDLENGVALEDVLQGLPEDAQELASLLRLASALRTAPHPEPLAETIHTQRRVLEEATLPTITARPAQQIPAAVPASAYQTTLPSGARPMHGAPARTARMPWKWLGAGAFAFAGAALVFLCVAAAALSLWLSGGSLDRARVAQITGQVQIASGRNWKNIQPGDTIRQGNRLRTLGASSATLVFFDGSQTTLFPDSEVEFLALNGAKDGTLQVKIDQQAGETANQVTPFQDHKESYFLVQTASGNASVHGTSFNVKVMETGLARFSVDSGEVLVANNAQEVTLLAGQATSASALGDLASPTYQFSISGSVSAIDEEARLWIVSGMEFQVVDTTVITGAPVIGDSVVVTGRILSDGSRIADAIAPTADSDITATFTGTLTENEGTEWLVNDQTITVTGETEIVGTIAVGTPVKVTFNLLDDGTWLALKIESLLEDPGKPTPLPTATSDPDAMPSYEFTPDELEMSSCESSDFNLTGTLHNTADHVKDYAANVELNYEIIAGGEYVDRVELAPSGWVRIDARQTVTFNIRVVMDEGWEALPEGTEVKLRVFIASATNRPDHRNGRLTVTIASGCEKTPTPSPSPTFTLTPTITPTGTLTITPTVTPEATQVPPESGQCTGANPHPTGMKLAQRYGVPYEEIMYWFCQHFGFGEIDLAYSLSRQTGVPVEKIFAMKSSGMGWGNIKKSLLPNGKPDKPGKGPKKNK